MIWLIPVLTTVLLVTVVSYTIALLLRELFKVNTHSKAYRVCNILSIIGLALIILVWMFILGLL